VPPLRPSRRLVGGLAVLALGVTTPAAVGTAVPAEPVSSGALAQRPDTPQGYPRQTQLEEPATDLGDAALKPGLTAYHEIAPLLNELQATSDRVSTEVIGTTATGREIYLVTLTAPETTGQAQRQEQMRRRILERPEQAAQDPTLARDYKVPVFVNANIHGNEWEGTDAALRLIQDYATSTDPEVLTTLESTRISLVVSMNPDGRVGNSRSNSAGFDLNRDFITATQPETRAVRDAIVRTQPMLLVDLHGYVNGTLVEPTTPPHAENLEFDLMLKHAWPNGLAIEEAILALGYDVETDGVRPPQIPFRDWDEGWDGWPPIFTPQYAALHGAAAHTIEFPLRINNASYSLGAPELQRRAAINSDIAHAAVTATLEYAVAHRAALVEDQVEWFRRGVTGSEQVPVTALDIPGAGPEDVYLTDYPRGYVIPVGQGQRSAPAAARLVDHLVDNGVEVTAARRPVTVAGTTYPAGSYVVDMQQAKRGIAGVILGPGTDISPRVDAMYDISGWSHALLWGADVVTVPAGTPLQETGPQVDRATAAGGLTGNGPWRLDILDPADAAAFNDLLAAGVTLTWTEDGGVVVPASARSAAAAAVQEHGVVLTPTGSATGAELESMDIAVAASPGERWALGEMGFAVTPVTTSALNAGFDWTGIETLYVSSGLSYAGLNPAARADLTEFLAGGGGIVARGSSGTAFHADLDALEVTTRAGRSDANGVAAVDNADGPVTAGAAPHTFVYSPLWFTELGEDVVVDQTYATDDVLVSGHWRPRADGTGGQGSAAGQAVVVRGVDTEGATAGARVALFGSEPLFRAHPKGQYSLVARALIWAGAGD
jgi:hypothetical protein